MKTFSFYTLALKSSILTLRNPVKFLHKFHSQMPSINRVSPRPTFAEQEIDHKCIYRYEYLYIQTALICSYKLVF